MAHESGTRLGHYEITDQLGKGGMGEVYRARDTKLGREVAIKVLPAEFARDEERLARLDREARMLAALNHPNIAAIHGLEQSEDTRFLVLELVEGDTLADRLTRGAIPLDESLKLALQIAEALEAAHNRGVIHRDLKPANIKVNPEGKIKVLDFGLAKALIGTETHAHLSNSPTLSIQATERGVILGTAAYMSPEQAQGEEVDKRADVWAFGCVLYEMLTGQKAFAGDNVSRTLARILERDPDFSPLPPNLDPRVRELLERCLEKQPGNRWHAIADVRVGLQKALASPARPAPESAGVTTRPEPSRLPWVAAVILSAALTALGFWLLTPAPEAMVTRFDDVLPEGSSFRVTARPNVAVSPDGTRYVYNGNDGLYMRTMGEREPRLIPGTEGILTNPVFSPDGASLAYFTPGTGLQKIAAVGGAPVTLAAINGNPFGISWDVDDTILFGAPDGTTISSVSSDGGEPQTLLEATEPLVGYPQLLPGGAMLFADTNDNVNVEVPGSGDRMVLFPGQRPRYTPTGHIVYVLDGVLFAVPFDVDSLEVTGGPVPLVQGVNGNQYSISDSGSLVYVPGTAVATGSYLLAFVEDDGRSEIVDPRPAVYRFPRISPDGDRIAVQINEDGQSSIWIYDLTDAEVARTRLTLPSEGNNTNPVWISGGEFVAFSSNRDGVSAIYRQRADGTGAAERLTMAEGNDLHLPESWSPNGVLSFARVVGGQNPGDSYELWTVDLEGDREPVLYYDLPFSNQFGSFFSPDGEWIAYSSGETSNDATEFGVYVERFPDRTDRREVARDGASWPVWTADDRIVYRLAQGQQPTMMSVRILATDPVLRFTEALRVPIQNLFVPGQGRDYDPAPDGRLLMVVASDAADTDQSRPQVNVVLNWFEELKERVPLP